MENWILIPKAARPNQSNLKCSEFKIFHFNNLDYYRMSEYSGNVCLTIFRASAENPFGKLNIAVY
jgi:hypothetical protein